MAIEILKKNDYLLPKLVSFTLLLVSLMMGYIFYLQNAILVGLPVLETSDVKAYKNAAAFLIDGRFLYGKEYTNFSSFDLPWIMSPFAASLFIPMIIVPDGWLYPVQIIANLSMLMLVMLILLRKRLSSLSPAILASIMLGMLIISASYSPVQNTLLTGQVNIFILTLIILDTIYLREKHPNLQGFLTGVAAGIKIVPLIFIVYYFLTKQYKAAQNALIGFASTIAIGFIIATESSLYYWGRFGFIRNASSLEYYITNSFNQSINGLILRSEMIPSELKQLLWFIISSIVGIVVLAFSVSVYRNGKVLESVIMVGFASLLCSPLSWIHHGVWVVPAMILLLIYSQNSQKYFFYWIFGSILLIKQFIGPFEPNIMFSFTKNYWFNTNWWVIVYIIFIVFIIIKNINFSRTNFKK